MATPSSEKRLQQLILFTWCLDLLSEAEFLVFTFDHQHLNIEWCKLKAYLKLYSILLNLTHIWRLNIYFKPNVIQYLLQFSWHTIVICPRKQQKEDEIMENSNSDIKYLDVRNCRVKTNARLRETSKLRGIESLYKYTLKIL